MAVSFVIVVVNASIVSLCAPFLQKNEWIIMRRVNVQNDAHRVTQVTYSFYCPEHTSYPTYSKFEFYDRKQFRNVKNTALQHCF